jgi:hypothetical protein
LWSREAAKTGSEIPCKSLLIKENNIMKHDAN